MREANIYDKIARLHIDNIEQGFLPLLGPNFLALLYRAIDESESGVLLFSEQDGELIGFVSGADSMRSIYRRLLNHFPQLIFSLAPSLIYPRRFLKIIEILLYSVQRDHKAVLPKHELLSIVVCPEYRGKRVAQGLYMKLANYFRKNGANSFAIIVGDELKIAQRFYTAQGAKAVSKISVHKNVSSIVFLQDLNNDI
jgi:GNAT superfamily N-acetyltransferase